MNFFYQEECGKDKQPENIKVDSRGCGQLRD